MIRSDISPNTKRQLFVAILRPIVEKREGVVTYEELMAKTGLPLQKIQTTIHKAFADIRRDYGIHFVTVPKVGYKIAAPSEGNDYVDSIRRRVHKSARKASTVTSCVVSDPKCNDEERKRACINQSLLGAVASASSMLALKAANAGLLPIANGTPQLATAELMMNQ